MCGRNETVNEISDRVISYVVFGNVLERTQCELRAKIFTDICQQQEKLAYQKKRAILVWF